MQKATAYLRNWTRAVVFDRSPPGLVGPEKMVPLSTPVPLLLPPAGGRRATISIPTWPSKPKKRRCYTQKDLRPPKFGWSMPECNVGTVLPFLTGKDYHLFFLVDKHGKILGEVTEEELMHMINEENMFNLNRAIKGQNRSQL